MTAIVILLKIRDQKAENLLISTMLTKLEHAFENVAFGLRAMHKLNGAKIGVVKCRCFDVCNKFY